MDPSVGVAEDASVKGWVLTIKDRVLVKAVALAVGAEDLQACVLFADGARGQREPIGSNRNQ